MARLASDAKSYYRKRLFDAGFCENYLNTAHRYQEILVRKPTNNARAGN